MDRPHEKKFYTIPYWCGMHKDDHFDGMGGCWGISYGYVFREGRDYCKCCDLYKANIKRTGQYLCGHQFENHRVPLANQRQDGYDKSISVQRRHRP